MSHACLKSGSLFLLLALLLAGCSPGSSSPDEIVQTAVLNGNRMTMAFRPGYFDEMKARKHDGGFVVVRRGEMVQDGTAEESIRGHVAELDEALADVEALRPVDDEGRALVQASRELLQQGRTMFEEDYMKVALLLDEGRPDTEVDAAIQAVYLRNAELFAEKSDRLGTLADAYAKANGINLLVR